MTIQLISKTINTAGLLLDIVGAWFVAYEVINQFKGKKIQIKSDPLNDLDLGVNMPDCSPEISLPPKSEETLSFKLWEIKKYSKMKIGLILLTLGFLFQIISSWITY